MFSFLNLIIFANQIRNTLKHLAKTNSNAL